jgi:cell division protease FtsH
VNDVAKNLILWVVIAVVLLTVFQSFGGRTSNSGTNLKYSDFLTQVKQGQVKEVLIEGQSITGQLKSGIAFMTYSPETDNSALIGEMDRANVTIVGKPPEQPSLLAHIFVSWFPFIVLIGLWVFFMRQMQGGGGGKGAMSFGKSKARLLSEDQINISFNDVAGVDEAKEERVKLKYRSLQSLVLTLLKCLLVLVPLEFETCLSKPKSTHPALYLLMKLMLLVGIVALEWVAVMTSVNKH